MKRERQRDEKGRFIKEGGGTPPGAEPKQAAAAEPASVTEPKQAAAAEPASVTEPKQTAADRLMAYAMEAPDRLRAMAEDPETPIKLRLEIERFFFELAYGKGGLAVGEPGSIQFEGELEEWSR